MGIGAEIAATQQQAQAPGHPRARQERVRRAVDAFAAAHPEVGAVRVVQFDGILLVASTDPADRGAKAAPGRWRATRSRSTTSASGCAPPSRGTPRVPKGGARPRARLRAPPGRRAGARRPARAGRPGDGGMTGAVRGWYSWRPAPPSSPPPSPGSPSSPPGWRRCSPSPALLRPRRAALGARRRRRPPAGDRPLGLRPRGARRARRRAARIGPRGRRPGRRGGEEGRDAARRPPDFASQSAAVARSPGTPTSSASRGRRLVKAPRSRPISRGSTPDG